MQPKNNSLKGVRLITIYKEQINIQTSKNISSYADITSDIQTIIETSGIEEGICVIVSPHTTCSVFFEEYSHDTDEQGTEFLQKDLNNVLKKIIPDHISEKTYQYPGIEHYEAVESWSNASDYLPNGDRTALWNGDAHLKSTLVGSSEIFEVSDGKLHIGTTGYIYFVDFDQTRERVRKCRVVVMGE